MAKIENVREVSATSGCCRVTFIGENLATGEAKIFSIRMSVPDQGLSYGLNTLKGRVKETQYNTDCVGEGTGLTSGDTTYTEGSLDMTFADDFNLLQSIDPTVSRSMIIAVFQGGVFEYGGENYAVLGTNGTRNIAGFTNDNDFKYLFSDEGKVITPDSVELDGTMSTEANNFITAYNKNNPVSCEFLYSFNQNSVKGDRFVYVLASECTFQEGTGADYNRYSMTASRYCDPKSMDKYMIQGVVNPQVLDISGTDSVYRVDAEYVIEVSGGGTPTVVGVAGEVAIVVDSDNGSVEVYKYGTTWIDVPVTSTLGQGCLIYTQQFDTALDGATAVAKAGYVSISTAGTTGNAIAVDSKTGVSGSGATSYFWDCMDWSYDISDFINYVGTGA